MYTFFLGKVQIQYFCTLKGILSELRELLFQLLFEVHFRNSDSHNLGLVTACHLVNNCFYPSWMKERKRTKKE